MHAFTGTIALPTDPSGDNSGTQIIASHAARTPLVSVRALPFGADEVDTSAIGFDLYI
jgi:hypothetical protein